MKKHKNDRTLVVLNFLEREVPKSKLPEEDEDELGDEDEGEEEDGIPKRRKQRPEYL